MKRCLLACAAALLGMALSVGLAAAQSEPPAQVPDAPPGPSAGQGPARSADPGGEKDAPTEPAAAAAPSDACPAHLSWHIS